jgi:tetratricopeptide (TPR) repeat protein
LVQAVRDIDDQRKFGVMESVLPWPKGLRTFTSRFAAIVVALVMSGVSGVSGWGQETEPTTSGSHSGNPVPIATATPTALSDDETAQVMLQRGDSLQASAKWVAALSMYKGAQQRSFDPCLLGQAAAGIAEVHLASENHHEARWATETAAEYVATCGHQPEMVLRVSDLWLGLNQDGRSRDLVDAALEAHPHPALWTEKVMLAHLAGHPESTRQAFEAWQANGGANDEPIRVAQVHAVLLQAQVMRDTLWLAAEEAAFEEALAAVSQAEECALREQVYLVLRAEGQTLTALHWAQTIRDRTPAHDLAGRTLAELRIAHCARDAHRPLEALIAYHEAEKAARSTGDNTLLAETLRQVATFETDRGNATAALVAWAQVDSINQTLIAHITPRAAAGRKRNFTTFVTPTADPFEQAAEDYLTQASTGRSASGFDLRSNPWVWAAAFGWLGLMAFAMKNKATRSVLNQERQRLATLRQLVHAKPTGTPLSPSAAGISLLPEINGEPVRSIDAVLRDIDASLEHPIPFEVLTLKPVLVSKSTSERLKALMTEILTLQTHEEIFGSAPLSIQVIDRDNEWQIRLNGPRISTSPTLRALFHPLPNLKGNDAGEWLRTAMRDLAAKLTVERGDGPGEAWVFTMPNVTA